jgi:hypothetical protein
MSVPPRARLLPVPGACGSGGERIRQYRRLAALVIFGTASAIDRE